MVLSCPSGFCMVLGTCYLVLPLSIVGDVFVDEYRRVVCKKPHMAMEDRFLRLVEQAEDVKVMVVMMMVIIMMMMMVVVVVMMMILVITMMTVIMVTMMMLMTQCARARQLSFQKFHIWLDVEMQRAADPYAALPEATYAGRKIVPQVGGDSSPRTFL
jgi:uncharacterized membrane protein YgcG